jgi:hypothetical protein
MAMKRLPGLVIAAFTIGIMLSGFASAATPARFPAGSRLLIQKSGRTGFSLVTVDLEGHQLALLAENIIPQIYLSPDHTKVSFRNEEGDLFVKDLDGALLLEYQFDFSGEYNWRDWWVWGWADDDSLIISHAQQARFAFFELPVTRDDPQFIPAERLNTFFTWRPDQIWWEFTSSYAYFMFQFGPGFESVLTPMPANSSLQNFYDAIFVWDLTGDHPAAVDVIESVFPWWENPIVPEPAWSHTGQKPVLAAFEAHMPALFIYVPGEGFRWIAAVGGPEDSPDLPRPFAWSPDDRRIAYWSMSHFNDSTRLMVVDVAHQTQQELLAAYKPADPIAWSCDGEYLAITQRGSYRTEGPQYFSISAIYIVDANTGHIVSTAGFFAETYIDIVGWVGC